MSNNKMIVDERQRDIGNFHVGRLLPFRRKRSVGPFIFIDHMGPIQIKKGDYYDVDQHPHIGLSTLTYLFEGQAEHKDSIGSHQIIMPGDVAFMSSGSGITHTERTPESLRQEDNFMMHGYQIWVALPKELEEMEPTFEYIPASKIESWSEGNFKLKLVAGEAFGKKAMLKGYSPLFMVDVKAMGDDNLNLTNHLKGEVAIVVVSGEIEEENEIISSGQMMISKSDEVCSIRVKKGTQLLIFGGETLPEKRYLLWNFASTSKERLQKAKLDWQNKNFPKILNDNTYIPFP
ncbi:pirin family protein [Candidatus Kapabacteria bacterium]|nr:pirin family protein [Candidatus Kapabacteria bacterium]